MTDDNTRQAADGRLADDKTEQAADGPIKDDDTAPPADGHHEEGKVVTAVGEREKRGPKVVVAVAAAAFVVVLTLAWNTVSYRLHGVLNPYYFVLSLFLSINLLIACWEMCLYLRHDYVVERARYWRELRASTGRNPAVGFLTAAIPLRRVCSPTLWADVWAAYALYDDAYTRRSTFGFNADIGNGFFTPIPSMVLLAALTTGFMPATIAGILGIALFWQWVYVSSLYAVSVWVAGSHEPLPRATRWLYVWGPNAVWIVVPLLGLFVSARLILDGTYGIVGH